MPRSKHIYIVAEENRSYEHVYQSQYMPYLNSLLAKNSVATQFYANQHSSLPNYFWVTAGQPVTTNNETTATYNVDNIVRRLIQKGLTYRAYAQSLPSTGWAGVEVSPYVKRHTALPYYSDMGNSTTQMKNLVSTTHMATDIANGDLPNFAFIAPDLINDMHNCPSGLNACMQKADAWLKTNIAPLLARPEFQPGGDGLLIIWADEADLGGVDEKCSSTDSTGCGGHILVGLIGPQVKAGFKSTKNYHHESVLRTILEMFGETSSFPGAAQNAPDMAEFFKSNAGVAVSSPSSGTSVASPLHVVASASAPQGIDAMKVYLDGTAVYTTASASIDTSLAAAPGDHKLTIKAWDSLGTVYTDVRTVTVAKAFGVEVTLPAATTSTTTGTSLHVVAGATASQPISAMKIYADSKSVYSTAKASLDTTLTLSKGTHTLVIKAWDSSGAAYSATRTVTLQ